jgi:hypothetical protein
VLEFRCWPKPRLEIVGDRLVTRGPVSLSTREYLEKNPVSIQSYLWNLFLYSPSRFLLKERLGWRGARRITAEKRVLNRRILEEIEHELSSRNIEHFFLVFHGEQGAVERWAVFNWEEKLIEDIGAEFSVPVVDTRAFLKVAADGSQEKCAHFYGHEPPMTGHHNAIGNLICFEGIRKGLVGDFSPPNEEQSSRLKQIGALKLPILEAAPRTFLGRAATLTTNGGQGILRATETANPERFLLRAGPVGPTTVNFELAGAAKHFTGLLHTMAGTEQGCPEGDLHFTVELDGVVVLECEAPPAASPRAIELDLAQKKSLTFSVRGDRGGGGCAWICLESPHLE